MDIKIYRLKHSSLNGREGEAIFKGPEFEFCLDPTRPVSKQGTLYTEEGYGTVCAVVNQL